MRESHGEGSNEATRGARDAVESGKRGAEEEEERHGGGVGVGWGWRRSLSLPGPDNVLESWSHFLLQYFLILHCVPT